MGEARADPDSGAAAGGAAPAARRPAPPGSPLAVVHCSRIVAGLWDESSKEIIGVVTISSRNKNRIYTHTDIDVLTPLLSNAAFTYENLRLLKETEQGAVYQKFIEKIFKLFNSSFRDSELIHAILSEIHSVAA